MSLQPSDPAADAFERLRLEVALLRRAVEGMAAETGAEPIDYSPTLAELSAAVAEVNTLVTALGDRPALVLGPEHLGALLHQAAGRLLAKPVAELERERAVLGQASETFRASQQASLVRARSWKRVAAFAAGGTILGAVVWAMILGPMARALPAAWGVPERLAAATLDLPVAPAGERLLQRSNPEGWALFQRVRRLPAGQQADLQRCLDRFEPPTRAQSCTLKLRKD